MIDPFAALSQRGSGAILIRSAANKAAITSAITARHRMSKPIMIPPDLFDTYTRMGCVRK